MRSEMYFMRKICAALNWLLICKTDANSFSVDQLMVSAVGPAFPKNHPASIGPRPIKSHSKVTRDSLSSERDIWSHWNSKPTGWRLPKEATVLFEWCRDDEQVPCKYYEVVSSMSCNELHHQARSDFFDLCLQMCGLASRKARLCFGLARLFLFHGTALRQGDLLKPESITVHQQQAMKQLHS